MTTNNSAQQAISIADWLSSEYADSDHPNAIEWLAELVNNDELPALDTFGGATMACGIMVFGARYALAVCEGLRMVDGVFDDGVMSAANAESDGGKYDE